MKVQELKDKLSEFGVPFPEDAKKADLEKIHAQALEDGVFDGEDEPEAEEQAPTEEPAADGEATEEVEETPEEEPEEEAKTSDKYEVVSKLSHDGVTYEEGDEVKGLTASQARRLLHLGVIK